MLTQSPPPTILIITGAWHIPEHYSTLSNRLRHQGYKVECPLLPTNNNAIPPTKSLDDDIAFIRTKAIEILDRGNDIVALMHSYGGVVGSNALSGLGPTDRTTFSSVKALIYMSAFISVENESLTDIFGGGLPPWLTPNDQELIDIDNPGLHFYSDLEPAEQKNWAGLLVVHPMKAQFEGPKESYDPSAWRTIPVTYLVCRGDQGLIEPVQDMMIGRIEKVQEGLHVNRVFCDASHSPFLSMPDRVVEVVTGVCNNMGN